MADPTVKVRLVADGRQAQTEIKRTEGAFSRLGTSLRANALKIAASLATVTAAFQELRRASALEAQTQALRRQLADQGQSLDAFIAKLKEVSDAQISTADLIASSSRALLLGIPAEQIADLLEIARARAIALGTDVSKAFEDLTLGLARRSIPILDNLGFTTRDLAAAQVEFAEGIGKTTDQLTAQEQSQALLNGILKQGKADVEAYGEAQSTLGASLEQTVALLKDFRTIAGQVATVLAGGFAAVLTRAANGFVLLGRAVFEVTAAIAGLLSGLPLIGKAFDGIEQSALRTSTKLGVTSRSLVAFAEKLSSAADTAGAFLLGLKEVEEVAPRAGRALENTGNAAEKTAAKLDEAASSTETLVDEYGELVQTAPAVASSFQAVTAGAAQATQAIEALGRRVDIFNEQGQRVGSRLRTDPQGGLFPGLSGATYQYTVQRSTTDAEGRVFFNGVA